MLARSVTTMELLGLGTCRGPYGTRLTSPVVGGTNSPGAEGGTLLSVLCVGAVPKEMPANQGAWYTSGDRRVQ